MPEQGFAEAEPPQSGDAVTDLLCEVAPYIIL
jgi:hypothetical protein